jgi:hypothetical protein
MLVTRKPRKRGKKKHKIIWSKKTLRDQLWWLKPQKKVKVEVKDEVDNPMSSLAPNSSNSSSSQPRPPSPPAAAPHPQLAILVKVEPGTEDRAAGDR